MFSHRTRCGKLAACGSPALIPKATDSLRMGYPVQQRAHDLPRLSNQRIAEKA